MGCCAPANTNTQVIRNDLSKDKQSSLSKDNQPNGIYIYINIYIY